MNFLFRSAIIAGVAFCTSAAANAASTSYFLNQSNDLANGTNYATVTISDSTDFVGDIEFKVEVDESQFPTPFSNFGMDAFFFNHDNSISIDELCLTDFDPTDWEVKYNKNAGGGFGKFDILAKGDGSSRTSVLTFRVTGVAGDTIEDYALGSADNMGEFFAAHIAGYDSGVSGNTSGKFAGSTAVPVPAAAWLFGSALGMLGWSRRR